MCDIERSILCLADTTKVLMACHILRVGIQKNRPKHLCEDCVVHFFHCRHFTGGLCVGREFMSSLCNVIHACQQIDDVHNDDIFNQRMNDGIH